MHYIQSQWDHRLFVEHLESEKNSFSHYEYW